jgi:DNA mismatch endonuclease, patch repair protein
LSGQAYKRIEKRLAGKLKLTTDAKASARMSRVRQHGTAPELMVRQACTAAGLHYRVRNRELPGSPDLANRSRRWAIFVHGCYWHRHEDCRKATVPRSNVQFWTAKFERNIERDLHARGALRDLGYTVLTIWQCEAELPAVLARRIAMLSRALDARS